MYMPYPEESRALGAVYSLHVRPVFVRGERLSPLPDTWPEIVQSGHTFTSAKFTVACFLSSSK
jgi:hypothetical protein